MRIQLLAVGQRMPKWVKAGFEDYQKRMPRSCRLELVEIAPGNRHRGVERAMQEEEKHIFDRLRPDTAVIALEVKGKAWHTETLADHMHNWLADGRDRALLIGGPDGLTDACRQRAEQLWSLSNLTLPHPLVRIVVAEQLYRAHSILSNHPYHRGG